MIKTLLGLIAAATLVTPSLALEQKPVGVGAVITETFTITAIDRASRIVTLEDKNKISHDVLCGPEVQRFDALKVGETVTFRYYESIVSAISRPGSNPNPSTTAGVVRNPGAPGGTMAQQSRAIVTIEAIDPAVPSITVKTQNGRRMSFRIENAKNVEGYKPGDQVEVTYTQALAVSVSPGK